MSEIKILNGYIIKDEISRNRTEALKRSKIHAFENVESMISDNDLVEGMHVKTLGYYDQKDGGGAEYIITNDENLVSNDMNIIQLSNGLFAILIIDKEININSFGAKNDGSEDSSNIFNYAFELINDMWLNNNYGVNTIICNGTYLWENQVKMPPCARLRGSGYTTILTDVANDSALFITYLDNRWPSNFSGNKADWQYAELINFSNGGIFKNINGDHQNTCLEIGTRTNMNTQNPYRIFSIARCVFSNFRIFNYNIAELVNGYNTYMIGHNHISYEDNNTCVQFGIDSSSGHENAGEQFSFYNCLFATATTGFLFHQAGFDISLVNCHLDFIQDIYNDIDNKGYKRVVINQSHIEGFTNILKKLGQRSNATIENCTITDNANARTKYFDDINSNAYIYFNNNKLLRDGAYATTSDPENNTEHVSSNIYGEYNTYSHGNKGRIISGSSNYLDKCFDGLEDGDVSLSQSNYINGMVCVPLRSQYLSSTGRIVTDNYMYQGHKSLVLTRNNVEYNEGDTINIHFQTDFLDVNKFIYYANMYAYNHRGGSPFNIAYDFYDKDKNLIKHNSYYNNTPSNEGTPNNWYMGAYPLEIKIPKNVRYFKVNFICQNLNRNVDVPEGTEFKIGGLIIN